MKIRFNGQHHEVDGQTVLDLLHSKRLEPHLVAVELNTRLLEKDAFATTRLQDGDEVEVLHYMGGGQGLTEEQILRYSRHILLAEVGGQGQKRIRDARVFIVGVGGLGSPVALYLAAAGVGTLGLIDSDTADLSNLQRQVIHTTRDLGTPKVLSAQARIAAINPDVKVECMFERLTSKNILDRIRNYDILVDGSDTFATKFLLNDAAVMAGKPLIHGGILRFVGQVFTILPKESACYRCLFKEPPPPGAVPSCQEAGILGAVAGVIGTIQATEVLKLILKKGRPLADRLLTYDALTTRLRTVRLHRQPGCQVCGPNPEITVLRDEEQQVCTS